MMAAALLAIGCASTTRMTGRSSHLASSAVLPGSDLPSKPSNKPFTPSTTASSFSSIARPNRYSFASRGNIQPSRLCDGTPAAISCKPGSIKSGPILNGCMAKPRFRNAFRSPKVTVVLPEPVMGAEMTHPFMMLEERVMVKTSEWTDEGVRMIDQRKLPMVEEYPVFKNYRDIAGAIRSMVVRGAPAIGVAAAMGIALGVRDSKARNMSELREEFNE